MKKKISKFLILLGLVFCLNLTSLNTAYSIENISPFVKYTSGTTIRNFKSYYESSLGTSDRDKIAYFTRNLGMDMSLINDVKTYNFASSLKEKTIEIKDSNYTIYDINYWYYLFSGGLSEAIKKIVVYKDNICIGNVLIEPVFLEFSDDPFWLQVQKLKENKEYTKDILEIKEQDKNKIKLITYETKFSGFTERYVFVVLKTQKVPERTILLAEMFYPSVLEKEMYERSKNKLKAFIQRSIYYRDYEDGMYFNLNVGFEQLMLDKAYRKYLYYYDEKDANDVDKEYEMIEKNSHNDK